MPGKTSAKPKYRKLFVTLGIVIFLIASYFIYKYSYIHIERHKYDQAAAAINSVADDLRSQGINTKFSRGCQRAEGVFGPGAMSCSVGITFKGDQSREAVQNIVAGFMDSMKNHGFSAILNSEMHLTTSPVASGSSLYSLINNSLGCQITLSNSSSENTYYQTMLSCGQRSRFQLF